MKAAQKFRSIIQLIESYLFGVKMESFQSEIHGELATWLINGRLVLNSKNANQSHDSLHRVFQYCFRRMQTELPGISNILLLGLGTGSIPSILEDELGFHIRVIAIEKDPVMIEIGKKYFGIGRFRGMEIIEADASDYVLNCKQQFDMVIIDLFIDNKVPLIFTSSRFLDQVIKLMHSGSCLLFNLIITGKAEKKRVELLMDFFSSQPGVLKLFSPVSDNRVLYWRKE